MGFVEIGIELLVMIKDFILLRKFNVPAHHNDCLPHEKHKKSADQRLFLLYNAGIQNLCFEGAVSFIKLANK